MVKPIRLLALDIDGVLTDGCETLGAAPSRKKKISFHDLDAVTAFRRAGHQIALVTGEDNETVTHIAERFGCPPIRRGAKDKVKALQSVARELRCPLSQTCYIGDSDRDAPAMLLSGLGCAPANATPAAKRAAHVLLLAQGGHGAVAEAVRILFRRNEIRQLEQDLRQELRRTVGASAHGRRWKRFRTDWLAAGTEVAHALQGGRKVLLAANNSCRAVAEAMAWELAGWDARSGAVFPVLILPSRQSPNDSPKAHGSFFAALARQIAALSRPGDVLVWVYAGRRQQENLVSAMAEAKKHAMVAVEFPANDEGAAIWRVIRKLSAKYAAAAR